MWKEGKKNCKSQRKGSVCRGTLFAKAQQGYCTHQLTAVVTVGTQANPRKDGEGAHEVPFLTEGNGAPEGLPVSSGMWNAERLPVLQVMVPIPCTYKL